MASTRTQRLMDLIALLAGRHIPLSQSDIRDALPAYAEGTETSRRQRFERDKRALRDLGVPIETVEGGAGDESGYRLRRGDFYLPALRVIESGRRRSPARRVPGVRGAGTVSLGPAEAAAVVEALSGLSGLPACPLANEARAALMKLTVDLPSAEAPALLAPPSERGEAIRRRMRMLGGALQAACRVRFRYLSARSHGLEARTVAPYGLLYRAGAWYVVGHDETRRAIRTFRVSRMHDLEVDPPQVEAAGYQIPEGFRIEAYARREPWELGREDVPSRVARVRFAPEAVAWARRNGWGTVEKQEPDGSEVRHLEVGDPEALMRWVLSLRGAARIELPAEWRDGAREMAKRIAEAHSCAVVSP